MREVIIELVGLGASRAPGATLSYQVHRQVLTSGIPDAAARAMCPDGVEVLHSTSWRCEPSGAVVLTYAAGPVPPAPGMHPLLEPSVVCSGDPLTPSPADLHAHHVAAHAVRHLAYLLARDPGVHAAATASALPVFWDLVERAAEMPTGTHRDAHRQAHAQARPSLRSPAQRACPGPGR